MSDFVIREANHNDILEIEKLIEDGYRNEIAKKGWTYEADLISGARLQNGEIETCLNDENQKLFVASNKENIHGVICVFRDGDWIEFGKFAVNPNYQGLGIGKMLIKHVEKFVFNKWKSNKLKLCVLTIRYELIDFYRRLGFVETGEIIDFIKIHPYVILKDGVEDLSIQIMEKKLADYSSA